MRTEPAPPGEHGPVPPATWRALPAGWAAWWLDRSDDETSSADGARAPAPTPAGRPARPRSLMARRLHRRASGRAAAWPVAEADPRWAGLVGVPAPTLTEALRLLAGVWLGAAGPDWADWTVVRRRWALGLASTAPFHALCPDLQARLLDEPERAASWAWHELRPRMERGCPGLWRRAGRAWPDGEPPGGAPGLWTVDDAGGLPCPSATATVTATAADTARVLRLWRACLQAATEVALAGAAEAAVIGDRSSDPARL